MIAETIVARLEADTRNFESGMARAGSVTDQLGNRTTGATHGIFVMRQALAGLAFQATGTAGPVGRLAEGLLLFGGGSTLVIGVAAGIGLIAAAYKIFTAETRAAEKAQLDFIAALQKTPQGSVVAARIQLQTAQEALRAFETVLANRRRTQPGGFDSDEAKHQQLLRAVAAAQNAVAEAERNATKAADAQLDVIKRHNEELRKEREALEKKKQLLERLNQLDRELTFRAMHGPGTTARLTEGLVPLRVNGRLLQPGELPTEIAQATQITQTPEAKNRILAQLHEIFGHMDEDLVNIGVDMGRNIIEGIMSGMLKMNDILKRFVISLLSTTLFGALGNALSGLIGQGPSFGASASASANAITQNSASIPRASFNLTASGMPPATTPFAVMRDAEWIRFLTGSLVVARSNGFRP